MSNFDDIREIRTSLDRVQALLSDRERLQKRLSLSSETAKKQREQLDEARLQTKEARAFVMSEGDRWVEVYTEQRDKTQVALDESKKLKEEIKQLKIDLDTKSVVHECCEDAARLCVLITTLNAALDVALDIAPEKEGPR